MRMDKENEGIKRSLPVFTKPYCSEERRGGRLKQADMLLPKTLSVIRIDAYVCAVCHGPCSNTSAICGG